MQQRQDQIVIHKLKKITIISLIFMAIELLGGYYAHSIAILSDAFHLLSDVLAYIISLSAVLMSMRKAPFFLTFGYEKLQPLGALANVAIIWFLTLMLFIEATQRIYAKSIVEEPTYMLLTSFFGLGCNLYIMRVLHSDEHSGHACSHDHGDNNNHEHNHDHAHNHNHNHDHDHGHSHNHSNESKKHVMKLPSKDDVLITEGDINRNNHELFSQAIGSNQDMRNSPTKQNNSDDDLRHQASKKKFQNINIEAAYIHIITDIILSIGVICSALIIYFAAPQGKWTYWQLADPFCTYLFSIMALYSTISITKESFRLLIDGWERPQEMTEITEELKDHLEVANFYDFKLWSTNRGKDYAAVKVKLHDSSSKDLTSISKIFSRRKIKSYIEVVAENFVLQQTEPQSE